MNLDRLQIYFGEPYVIDIEGLKGNKIHLLQPTIGDLVRIGEKRFLSTLTIFTGNSVTYRVSLWDRGIDWNDISDFQMFCMVYKGADPEVASLLLDGVDLQGFDFYVDKEEHIFLYNPEQDYVIDERVFSVISEYYRTICNMTPSDEYTKDAVLKRWWVEKDRRANARAERKGDDGASLQPVISALVNHPGFKYKIKELKEVTLGQFYDSVARLQVYENTTALLRGCYSGMINMKEIKKENLNFMRDIHVEENNMPKNKGGNK